MIFLEGEEIVIPYPHKMFNSGSISLMRYDSSGNAIKNHFDNIVYQTKEGHEYGDINIKGLESGRYTLNFKKTNKTIYLSIYKGVYWESEHYILKGDILVEHKYKKTMKRITHFEVNDSEDSKNESSDVKQIKFKVDGAKDNLKVHVFASNIMPNNYNYFASPFEYLYNYPIGNTFTFKKFENEYLSNKKLNDELRYALERKYLKSFIGTTLDRPGLCYHRKEYCVTNFETEAAPDEQGYQRHTKVAMKSYAGISYKGMAKKKGAYSGGGAIDPSGATQRYVDLEHKDILTDIRKRKIELDKPLDSQFNYHETRNTVCLNKGEKHIIDDITSVEYQTIDSLNKVGKVLYELARLKHQENSSFNALQWIFNWNNADPEFKNKKYSKFMCNELNFFLYFKDKEFFDSVVRPGIVSKIEKSLIDYFLLEEYDKVDEYKHVSVYDSLNALEQCLLIAVVNRTDHECAEKLADQFINKAKLIETKTAKKHSKFDTVLLMKILESEGKDDEDDEDGNQLELNTIKTSAKKKKSKKEKKVVQRQRSMSMSSNSSVEEFNWANRNANDGSDYDSADDDSYGGEGDYGEGDYCENEDDDCEEECEMQYEQNCEMECDDFDDVGMSDDD